LAPRRQWLPARLPLRPSGGGDDDAARRIDGTGAHQRPGEGGRSVAGLLAGDPRRRAVALGRDGEIGSKTQPASIETTAFWPGPVVRPLATMTRMTRTGYSPTAWRTCQIGPKAVFRVVQNHDLCKARFRPKNS